VLNKFAVLPVQQFAYTSGKNASDSALIIDAMDLLYTRRFDGFCLVSSDSDFTGLARRIREEGLVVYGFGEQKTVMPPVSQTTWTPYPGSSARLRRGLASAVPGGRARHTS
jgi:uncharacterized LabA/DUF88 family protein